MLEVLWRGQPVFIIRPGNAVVALLGAHDELLEDPDCRNLMQPRKIEVSGSARALNPEYWIDLAVGPHLGCSPLGAFAPADEL